MTVEYLNLGEAEYMIIEGEKSGKIVVVINENLSSEQKEFYLSEIDTILRLKES